MREDSIDGYPHRCLNHGTSAVSRKKMRDHPRKRVIVMLDVSSTFQGYFVPVVFLWPGDDETNGSN